MAVSECRLLKGSMAIAAQMTLATMILGSLLYKRQRELPKRPFLVWVMDVSKQALSSSTCHIINMTFAILAGKNVSGEASEASECSWYFVQYNVDNVLGVPLTMLLHSAVIMTATFWIKRQTTKDNEIHDPWSFMGIIANCGNYGSPPKVTYWAVQVMEWILTVIAARSVSGCVVVLSADVALKYASVFIDHLFYNIPVFHLYFVLVIYPVVLSTCVAWMLDGLLKKPKKSTNVEEGLTEHFIDLEQS